MPNGMKHGQAAPAESPDTRPRTNQGCIVLFLSVPFATLAVLKLILL